MSANIRPLSPELQLIAKQDLHEEPSQIFQMLEQFREWIRKSPHLNSRTDDQFLIIFLRGCKYSLEKAKQKLDMFYTVRTHAPEMIGKRTGLDERTLEILRLGVMIPLPKSKPDGPLILVVRPGSYDADKFHIEEIIRVYMHVNDLLIVENDNLVVAGSLTIIDLKDATLGHLLQMQPSLIKKMTMLSQEGSPIRQKGIHYVNNSVRFDKVFNMFTAFMNEKVKKRVFVHGYDMESLFKSGVPKDILPKEYGGENESIDDIVQQWEKKIKDNYERLVEDVHVYKVDEKKRIGKPKNRESLFGIDGTFRKLEID